ncbi:MAG TPA: acyltransferase [Bacteroidia bacterium]|nr:acyltransferase [Bacteroidia bacterium]
MKSTENKVYFPGLDGMRLISCVSIILVHIDAVKLEMGVPVLKWTYYYNKIGVLSVSLFFVLSGFLISYLLLQEKQNTGTINMKGYYIRRILRIWPLYFAVIFMGFFVWPHISDFFMKNYLNHVGQSWWLTLLGCMLFLPATLFTINDLPDPLRASWTVRVEEVFYFFWPHLVKRTKNFIRTCLWIIIGTVVIRGISFYILNNYFRNSYGYVLLLGPSSIIMDYRISCMAIGGIGAYLIVVKDNKIIPFLYRKDVQFITYTLTVIALIAEVHIPFIHHEIFSALFTIIIMNLGNNPECIINLDYKWMNYFGKRTYGLYLYHLLMVLLWVNFVKQHTPQFGVWQMNIIIYAGTLLSTAAAAIISYQFLEKPFLKLKRRHTVIETRE